MRIAFRQIAVFAGRFFRDRGGQTAITFGLAAIPLLLVVGAAVDYSRAVTQRSNLQQASDAATLAMAHTNLNGTSTTSSLSGPLQTYLTGVLNGATLTSLSLADNNSTLCITTTFAVPTSVMAIANIKTMNVGASSCATAGAGSTSEVAVALDNSGSMADSAGGQSKMDALKIAAQKLVDILNPSGTANPNISISLVPFTALVNVGPDTNAFFLDKQGKSSIHWQNFHRPPPVLPLATFYPTSKLDLFTALNPKVAWGGCVEERPVPNITSDTPASTAAPDTLFVPFLSPDDPGDTSNNGCFFINPVTKAVSTSCYVPPAGSGLLNSHYFYNSYLYDLGAANLSAACLLNPLSATYDAFVSPLTPPDGQANVYPLGGETMVCKYNGGKVVSTQVSTNVATGPNYLCSSQQLTPLTTDRNVLSTAISTMQAGGSTNLATGFMWAWRTISPTVNPFPVASPATIGQQNPKSYSPTTPNQKVIILMTDGANSWTSNTYSPWLSTFEAFGYYVNNRIASYGDCNTPSGTTVATGDPTTARCQLDNVTLEACAKARKANIIVYTIGFSTVTSPIDAQGLNLLQSCATPGGNFFQASDSAGIVAAFQQIAQNIKGLRLTQ